MRILKINLRAFDGGAGAAAPAAASAGSSSAALAQPQAAGAAKESGSAPDAQAQQGTPAQQPEQAAKPSFDELIRGEYRKDFDARVKAAVERRVKGSKAELAAVRPVMAILQQRYGIADDEHAAEAVRQALEKDDAYWQSAADAAGLTTAQYRQVTMAEARSRELQALLAAQQTEQRRNEVYRTLSAQVGQVKAQYPDFDVDAELQNTPQFGELIRNGIDMLTAYQVCHQRELLAAVQRQAEEQTMDKVRANQARPTENGSGSAQPAKLSGDPSRWTREQLREVERRVQRGERIVL